MELKYNSAGPKCTEFIECMDYFTGIQGPVGSGKSSAAVINILIKAMNQKPGPDGVARTRWAVLRNTYSELETTTLKTWVDWLPEAKFGRITRQAPFTQNISMDLGTHVCEIEVLFIALDRADQIGKLLSLELTGAWLNEAREFPKEVLDAVTMRVGRFPAVKDGGPTWFGVIADTNAPSEDHWWAVMSGQAPPPEWMTKAEADQLIAPRNWKFVMQPAAMQEIRDKGIVTGYELNPGRENKNNLVDGYYEKQIEGKTKPWINVYLMNQCDSLRLGAPIYPEYNVELHRSKERLRPVAGQTLYVGMDFGLTPAAVFAQRHRGRWQILGEYVTFNTSLTEFIEELKMVMEERDYPEERIFFGDPSGDARFTNTGQTTFQLLRQMGVTARKPHTNDPVMRWESVRRPLMRIVDGVPAFNMCPSCSYLHKGFAGAYVYGKDGKALKNDVSHVHDALQYLLLGSGEGRNVGNFTKDGRKKAAPIIADHSFSVFGG